MTGRPPGDGNGSRGMALARRNIGRKEQSSDKSDCILVLEDDAHYLDLMSATLTPFQDRYAIVQAQSVEEAHRRIEGRRVRVFVLDVQLPDGTGLDFFESVREWHPGAVSVVVTGTNLIADRQFTERFGVDRLIRKPFRLAALRESVAELLEQVESGGPVSGARLAGAGVEEIDHTDSGGMFTGVLKKLSITDIVQLKCISQSSTIITLLSADGQLGKIHLMKGQIIHAETGDLLGVEALNRIVLWNSGKVSESLPQEGTPLTIEGSWESLLMDAMRHKDELSGIG